MFPPRLDGLSFRQPKTRQGRNVCCFIIAKQIGAVKSKEAWNACFFRGPTHIAWLDRLIDEGLAAAGMLEDRK